MSLSDDSIPFTANKSSDSPSFAGPSESADDGHNQPKQLPVTIGGRQLESRFFLAPLAGYTHLAFRIMLRRLGGLGLATTDLVQAQMLISQTRKSMELIETSPEDRPLSVQIFGGVTSAIVDAAKWLQDNGYQGIDLNMGCPMAKINGSGGGARLMCNVDSAVDIVQSVISAVKIPVTVKMRLGWDSHNLTAPTLAKAFEDCGVAAVTVHGRTRQQGFHGEVDRDGIAETVDAVSNMPIVANGDVRTVEDAFSMMQHTGCAAIAIGRGAMLDPWIFSKLKDVEEGRSPTEPTSEQHVCFLRDHFYLMVEQHGEYSCKLFRKFAAWYGATLRIPEDLEDRLRRFESESEFDALLDEIAERHGQRTTAVATALIRVPNGPIEHW